MKKSLLIIFLTICFTNISYGCDCKGVSYQEAIEQYGAIFTAKVLKITDDPETCYKGDCIGVFVELAIITNYRGTNKDTITVYTMKYTPSCGYPFEIGRIYLVYSNKINENYHVSLCSRTTELENAQEDIKLLNNDFKE